MHEQGWVEVKDARGAWERLEAVMAFWPVPARRVYRWLREHGENGYVRGRSQQEIAEAVGYADARQVRQALAWLTEQQVVMRRRHRGDGGRMTVYLRPPEAWSDAATSAASGEAIRLEVPAIQTKRIAGSPDDPTTPAPTASSSSSWPGDPDRRAGLATDPDRSSGSGSIWLGPAERLVERLLTLQIEPHVAALDALQRLSPAGQDEAFQRLEARARRERDIAKSW